LSACEETGSWDALCARPHAISGLSERPFAHLACTDRAMDADVRGEHVFGADRPAAVAAADAGQSVGVECAGLLGHGWRSLEEPFTRRWHGIEIGVIVSR
jgi:hypothetical protein